MRIDKKLDEDTLVRELQRLVDVVTETERQTKLMEGAGRASSAQVSEAAERVVKAKIELARQREAAIQSAGGEQLTKLTSDLSDLSIQLAEREATLPAIRNQLGQVEAQVSQAASAMPHMIERELAIKSLKQAEERIQDPETGPHVFAEAYGHGDWGRAIAVARLISLRGCRPWFRRGRPAPRRGACRHRRAWAAQPVTGAHALIEQ